MKASRVYVIAEAGVNHNGERDLAFALVDAAAESGVDAIKFQTFNAVKLASSVAPKAAYQKSNTGESESQLEMLRKLELPRAWHADLQAHAHDRGIEFLSTAFDVDSLGFLIELDVPMIKVPSGELTNAPLVWSYAKTGKPLIVSTGMATIAEVEQALAIIVHALNSDAEPKSLDDIWRAWSQKDWRNVLTGHVTLLHCTSQYPATIDEVNLKAMDTLANAFGLGVGYSDHTQGTLIPVAAVARGACLIEKHFTIDRNLSGPDHLSSLEPVELAQMVRDIRAISQALGDGIKAPQASEWDTRQAARQQVIAIRDISAGAVISSDDLSTARCGRGMPAARLWDMVGQTSQRANIAGEVIDE